MIMDLKEIYELTAKAFETNHVKELLLGKGEWCVPVNWKAPANTPTDWDRIIYFGVHAYCKGENCVNRVAQFEEAFISILKESTSSIMAGFELYFSYWYHIFDHSEENILFTPRLKKELAQAIKSNKTKLSAVTEWSGYKYRTGLYDNIVYLNNTIEKKFGAGIL